MQTLGTGLKPEQTAMSLPITPSSEIGKLLVVLAEARQASLGPDTIRIYSRALAPFDLADVQSAVTRMAKRPRREGETAFPELGAILAEVKSVLEARFSRVAIDTIEAEAKHRQEHPEAYESWKDFWASEEAATIRDRVETKRRGPVEQPPLSERLCCPECNTAIPVMAGTRMLSSVELRQWADIREQQERRAEERREEGQRVALKIHARDLGSAGTTEGAA